MHYIFRKCIVCTLPPLLDLHKQTNDIAFVNLYFNHKKYSITHRLFDQKLQFNLPQSLGLFELQASVFHRGSLFDGLSGSFSHHIAHDLLSIFCIPFLPGVLPVPFFLASHSSLDHQHPPTLHRLFHGFSSLWFGIPWNSTVYFYMCYICGSLQSGSYTPSISGM